MGNITEWSVLGCVDGEHNRVVSIGLCGWGTYQSGQYWAVWMGNISLSEWSVLGCVDWEHNRVVSIGLCGFNKENTGTTGENSLHPTQQRMELNDAEGDQDIGHEILTLLDIGHEILTLLVNVFDMYWLWNCTVICHVDTMTDTLYCQCRRGDSSHIKCHISNEVYDPPICCHSVH